MAKRDLYDVLGVSRTASADEIKKAHRKAVRQYHPDRNKGNPGAEEKFREAQEAYDILRDTEKRRAYDRFGHAGRPTGFDPSSAGPGASPGGFGRADGSSFEGFHFEGGDIGDLFGNLFGGRARTGPEKGEDAQGTIVLPFRDAR